MSKIHRYTDNEIQWMMYYSQAEQWTDLKAFFKAFNDKFNLTLSDSALMTYVSKHGINVRTVEKDKSYTNEQTEWIEQNLSNGVFNDYKHFTDIFNAVFGTHTNYRSMKSFMNKRGWYLQTKHNQQIFTKEQERWLRQNYVRYNVLKDLTEQFNNVFGTEYKYTRLQHYLSKNGLRKSDRVSGGKVGAQKQVGKPRKSGECPIGTIRYNAYGNPFIKVMLCEGSSHVVNSGKSGMREPFWKPLQKKIWEDHFGEVPKGYVVVSLNGDSSDEDINHIGIIDKRMRAVMGKKGWWTTHPIITGDGVMWCNLYATAKDHGVKFDRK